MGGRFDRWRGRLVRSGVIASSGTRPPTTVDELVPPQLAAALDRLDVSTRRLFAGKLQGERRSKARGRSVEFEDFRPYVPGDDLRHVDWNVFARLDRLFVKIFQEEQDLALHVVVDASASMDAGSPNKLVFAQKIAMATAYLGLVNNNRVALWIFGGGRASAAVRRLPPLRGRTGVQRVARFLLEETFTPPERMGGREEASFTRALRTIASGRTGRGVMVVLSDFLVPEGYREGLGLLGGGAAGAEGAGAAGWDITLLQVLSPGELNPMEERDGGGSRSVIGDLRLTDAETGRAAEVTVTPELVKRYLARLETHQTDLRSFAASRGMGLVTVRSDHDPAALMLDDLRRRGLLQ